jgi:hypothetical protein
MKIRLALLSCALAVSAFAADVSGKWTYEMSRGGNTMTSTITLKADGATLTGSVSGRNGDTAIANGKVDGDNVSFEVTREGPNGTMTMHYTGKAGGDEIKFTVTRQGGEPREFTAKRAPTT